MYVLSGKEAIKIISLGVDRELQTEHTWFGFFLRFPPACEGIAGGAQRVALQCRDNVQLLCKKTAAWLHVSRD
ncbi:hypothetical protein NQZ68_034708 [Dissostichus eleginoides]|nr:hypothetical protein NQZ68_034708 [Dissostichus eleginoides]